MEPKRKTLLVQKSAASAAPTVFSVNEFLREKSLQPYDPTGVYVLYNAVTGRWYVGQAKKLWTRVNEHLKGRGCKSFFQDFQKGHACYIQLLTLKESGYQSLDVLEHDLIHYYEADTKGYNTLRGNQMHQKSGYDKYAHPQQLLHCVMNRAEWSAAADAAKKREQLAPKTVPQKRKLSVENIVPVEQPDLTKKSVQLHELELAADSREACGITEERCYVTEFGKRYHTKKDCQFVRMKNGRVITECQVYDISVLDAESSGYLPCSRCVKSESE